jgi:FeS assembly SUF system protein
MTITEEIEARSNQVSMTTDGTNSSSANGNLRDTVIETIKTIYDPEIPVDIYELGLIYEITIFPINSVYIRMTLTSPACPSAEQIPAEVEQKVKGIANVGDVKVELTFEPPYTQEMMSEVARLELGFM